MKNARTPRGYSPRDWSSPNGRRGHKRQPQPQEEEKEEEKIILQKETLLKT